jgi:hypothetical protein
MTDKLRNGEGILRRKIDDACAKHELSLKRLI